MHSRGLAHEFNALEWRGKGSSFRVIYTAVMGMTGWFA